jgi:hypothetical protein
MPAISSSHHSQCDLKRTSVLLLLLMTAVTSGIYYPFWFLTRLRGINGLRSNGKLYSEVFIFAILIICLAVLLPLVSMNEYGLILSLLLQLVFVILMLGQCLKVRRILEDHFKGALGKDADISRAATLFFQIFYLQYKINKMS